MGSGHSGKRRREVVKRSGRRLAPQVRKWLARIARLIAEACQAGPLVRTRCGKRMSLIAFVTDQPGVPAEWES